MTYQDIAVALFIVGGLAALASLTDSALRFWSAFKTLSRRNDRG